MLGRTSERSRDTRNERWKGKSFLFSWEIFFKILHRFTQIGYVLVGKLLSSFNHAFLFTPKSKKNKILRQELYALQIIEIIYFIFSLRLTIPSEKANVKTG